MTIDLKAIAHFPILKVGGLTYHGLIRFVSRDLQNRLLKSCLIFVHNASLVP